MTYPQGVWVENPSGYPLGAWLYSGPVLFLPSNDAANTGMGVLILGPGGGKSNFPIAAQGEPGLPIVVDSSTATALSPGSDPTFVFTPVSPGGPGVAAHYTVQAGIPSGAAGETSAFALASATDLSGTAAVGMVPTVSSLGPVAFTLTTPPAVSWYSVPATGLGSIPATAFNVNTIKNLGSLAIPAKPFAWWPEVYATALTIGAVDTQVNLVARLGGSANTFPIISTSLGQAGVNPAPTTLWPQGLSLTAGIVAASTAATIFLNAENQTSSANDWNTAAGALFGVKVQPTT
jgi:hypothetical protein